jgi:heme oxygenase
MPDRPPNIAVRLKSATSALHAEVERTGIMRRLLAGRIDRAGYVRLLHNLSAIYATLEPLLVRHSSHPWIATIIDVALFRAEALRADLKDLSEREDRDTTPAPATIAYSRRLQALDRDAPQLLVAHAYVRYLGDLSGGQLLKQIVSRSLQLTSSAGLAFYDFGDSQTVAARAMAFRQALAALPVDDHAAGLLAAEAQHAFALHAALFRELDAGDGPVSDATA